MSSESPNPHSWRTARQLHDSDLHLAATCPQPAASGFALRAGPQRESPRHDTGAESWKSPVEGELARLCAGVKAGSPDPEKHRWRKQTQAWGQTASFPQVGMVRPQSSPQGAGWEGQGCVAGAREPCSPRRALGLLARGAKEGMATGVRRQGF